MKKVIRQDFVRTLSGIDDASEMEAFLLDVMTEGEISEISSRLRAAVMLNNGEKYTKIIESTGLSSRTIARISEWLKRDTGGYAKAIAIVKEHHKHI